MSGSRSGFYADAGLQTLIGISKNGNYDSAAGNTFQSNTADIAVRFISAAIVYFFIFSEESTSESLNIPSGYPFLTKGIYAISIFRI